MEKKWILKNINETSVSSLQKALGIHPILCSLLVQRGILTYDLAEQFFRPSLSDLHDPGLMKDMDKAVQRIMLAMNNKEKILVFGDYDVDGTTSVACFYHFLNKIYNTDLLDFYIPHRYREGYGVSKQGIDFAHENNFSLIVSLDCGIKSVDLITYAKTLGIDFIVCDHHQPDAQLPPAAAILNPKQPGCNYPYKELCGCGVGFKLITALAQKLGLPDESVMDYLDLVATAIAADIVPVTGENRILAHFGLKKANTSPFLGISAIKENTRARGDMLLQDLVFLIAPKINAAGRMDEGRKAVELFLCNNLVSARNIANELQTDNDDRKLADESITKEALNLLKADSENDSRKTTVLYQPHWHKGVVGIVAARLVEHYFRPTIVLTQSGEFAAGSARSVPGFNIYEAIHSCRHLLLGYGGHFYAAGLTIKPENIQPFIQHFETVVAETIKPEQLVPEINIDALITLDVIKDNFYNILRQMEPHGPENLQPIFIARNLSDTGHSRIVKEQHLKLSLKQNNHFINGIGFKLANKYELLQKGAIDLIFTIDLNVYNGIKSLQCKAIDIRPAQNA